MKAKIIASIALFAAAALGGYFFLRGHGQDAGAAAAGLALASVPDALSVSTPETRALPGNMRLYESKAFRFSIAFPEQLKVTQYEERGNAMTVTFVGPGAQEFEVYVTPYGKAQIDEARFKLDQPSGRYLDPQNVVIDGAQATLFTGYNPIMGDTREVWFIRDGFLYEVATYKPLDAWLGQMMQGWKFL